MGECFLDTIYALLKSHEVVGKERLGVGEDRHEARN